MTPSRVVVAAILVFLTVCCVPLVRGCAKQRREHKETSRLCRTWVHRVLADAKENPPERGKYESVLVVEDLWNQPLNSTLFVEELANTARVCSSGRDGLADTDDDVCCQTTDVLKRKLIEIGAQSAGKGLTKGIIEALKP